MVYLKVTGGWHGRIVNMVDDKYGELINNLMDEKNTIKNKVKDIVSKYPNNMMLGKKIREFVLNGGLEEWKMKE